MAIVLSLLFCTAVPAAASSYPDRGTLTLKLGPAVYHWRSSPEHNNLPWLVGIDWEDASRRSVGGVTFLNSFDQRSHYLYVGKRWFPDITPDSVYVKLTGGVMLGYAEPYDDKIPFNHRRGVAPAILPAVGYQFESGRLQVVPLGTAGVIFTFGVSL